MTPTQILTRGDDKPAALVERELTRRRFGRHEFTHRREIRWRLMGVSERMQTAHPTITGFPANEQHRRQLQSELVEHMRVGAK